MIKVGMRVGINVLSGELAKSLRTGREVWNKWEVVGDFRQVKQKVVYFGTKAYNNKDV